MKNKWILFSYSVPSSNAKARMRIWRRISAAGAVQLKTGLQILPDRDDLLENMTWLIGEVNSLGGEALAVQCAQIEGMEDDQIEKLFQAQLDPEYLHIQAEARSLLTPPELPLLEDRTKELSAILRKLRKRCEALQSRDFFPSGAASKTLAVLDATSARLLKSEAAVAPVTAVARSQYQSKTWVTRAQPYIDRLSSSWLISRFIDDNPRFRFLEADEKAKTSAGEIPFDIAGADFSHQGALITFEVMARDFDLLHPAIIKMAELVHFIDVQEDAVLPDDAALLKNIIDGLVAISSSDHQLLTNALLVFDALYAAFSKK
ncbi:chromate resistance protein ChrB domain-containing protein [Desulfopila sp. IMCC35006]|uniref:chromate resistance protein ChrB domain-containing protein n=1 Tax=Desulfopila sp. IMCC35006 TaxID=2569542 RepID=UPI00142EA95F|nr:chromate resistance protein ChrB domain-containing protein [Desulfopila sp. IMCC35006]